GTKNNDGRIEEIVSWKAGFLSDFVVIADRTVCCGYNIFLPVVVFAECGIFAINFNCNMANIIWVDEAGSTNSVLADMSRQGVACDGDVLAARAQSAGRGQRGNSWESEPGANLTFSMLFSGRGYDVSRNFMVSEAVALAVADVVAEEICGSGERVCVKWPNDIYVGDRKVCGILIENVLSGRTVERCIAGIGLNINQKQFVSDAPNPVSLFQIDGKERSVEDTLVRLTGRILEYMEEVESLHSRYMSRLWRKDGFYPYDDNLRGERVEARIADVLPEGQIVLELRNGECREYAFKEVSAVL
ncbi:MAG: biotin--[acetyl-CoA-carboxylase] ligase, partial [Paramuribaculum sp.]|nr:biotin--[acetyl-CoA-carboxylase] ligase [Paramuribaculum sp.]